MSAAVRAVAVASLLMFAADRLGAQDPWAVPVDAAGCLARHAELRAAPEDENNLAARFLLHFACGALAEARSDVAALRRLAPEGPLGWRFGLRLDALDPSRHRRTRAEAERFLRRFADDPTVSPAERQAVAGLRDWLAAELEHAEAVAAAGRRARAAPFAALALLLGLVLLLLARTRADEG
ncbi:MAG: hypothetical protein D6702_05045 [Planctomycetota bacterium]|nr:MAG: hypothetical protein D6702_05045 [Planctomycetota bacterium]